MSVTLVVAGAAALAGGLAVAWRRRRRPKMRRVRRPRRLDLADLKALAQKRVESMRDCRMRIVQREQRDSWLRLLIRVEPPNPQARWWPWALSVECPQQLACRDAAEQGGVLQGAMPRQVESHLLDAWLCGTHSVWVRVQPPADCGRLEVGYYGAPACFLDL